MGKITQGLLRNCPGATPWFYSLQRRWDPRSSPPYVDATIGFDLRTAVEVRRKKQPKPQERWLKAGYGSFVNKEGSNYEMGLGVHFQYERCPELRHPRDAIDLIAQAWLACKPLVYELTKKIMKPILAGAEIGIADVVATTGSVRNCLRLSAPPNRRNHWGMSAAVRPRPRDAVRGR